MATNQWPDGLQAINTDYKTQIVTAVLYSRFFCPENIYAATFNAWQMFEFAVDNELIFAYIMNFTFQCSFHFLHKWKNVKILDECDIKTLHHQHLTKGRNYCQKENDQIYIFHNSMSVSQFPLCRECKMWNQYGNVQPLHCSFRKILTLAECLCLKINMY